MVGIARRSRLDRCRLHGEAFGRTRRTAPWRMLEADEAATLVLHGIDPGTNHDELLEQIADSRRNVALFLSTPVRTDLDDLRDSEQGQVWGHALHPAPKSRDGVGRRALLRASPETGAAVTLFWFRVDPRLRRMAGPDRTALLRDLAGAPDLYPCHPWEASRLLDDPGLRRLDREGLVVPVGERGKALFPTSSVRTLYHPALPSFLKLSVHVRLTNCVRKNAWYELDSAVALSAALLPVLRAVSSAEPGFAVMAEPSASTLDLGAHAPADAARALGESFGILYREAIPASERAAWHPRVAMSLFTWSRDEEHGSACAGIVAAAAARLDLTAPGAARVWLGRYAALLCGGVLRLVLQHGVVLEPHLQNVLLGTDADGLPARIWVRDLEGTKLMANGPTAPLLAGMAGRVRESVFYDAEAGWRRTAYCLVVNNLAEAVFHLALAAGMPESPLWEVLRRELDRVATRLERENVDTTPLRAMLSGAVLPAKANLLTRLGRLADRDARYVMLPSPFAPDAA